MLYKLYQLCVALPVILLATVLTALTTSLGSVLGSAHFWGYWPGRLWSQLVCRVLLLPVRVEGREHLEKGRSYVFVANHQGPMDIFLVYGFLGRNFKWMMKKALRRMPLVGMACEKGGHIFVDKSGPKAVARTIAQARSTLRGGTSLVVFPEGARTFTGHMGLFRKGAFRLAADIGLDVVPVTIDGSFDVLRRQDGLNFVHRHAMHMVIHAPIPSQDADKAAKEAWDIIDAALPERHRGYRRNDDQ